MKIINNVNDNMRLQKDFENADTFIFKVIIFQWFLVSTCGGLLYSNYLFGFICGSLLAFVSIIGYIYYRGTQLLRVVNAIILMLFSIVLIQENLGTIEMHFHIFVMLSFLVIYKDILPVTTAGIFIAIHHLLFTYFQLQGLEISGMEIMIFNYGCGYDIAFLHAFFVVLEWGILARLIFIGIKKDQELIQTDTKQLELIKEVESIHKHTRDSIEYASLIQGALIPDTKIFENYFGDYLSIWQPKDVIGGDIYLFEELREKDECLLMVIDCTGHGVPGAFVTMLVKAIERQVIAKINNDHTIDVSPAWILSYFNKSMKQLLKQESEDSVSNAGFDGGIIYYNKKENTIKFAGAETPLFYIKDDEFKTIKGNRHSIGYKKSDVDYEFKEHIIPVTEGMKFYLSTDGYFDQNGGEKSFPFGKKRFSTLLHQNHNELFIDQKEILLDELQSYQKNEERNDDVTIVGFEIEKSVQIIEETIIEYEGTLTQGIISHTMEIIEKDISNMSMLGKVSTTVIELLQNMMHYGKSEGFYKLTKYEDAYEVRTKNIVSIDDKNKIEAKLLEIQSLDEAGIKKRYRELRRSGENTHGKGGGIGLYEIAKLVKDIEFNFIEIDKDTYSYDFSAKIVSRKIKVNEKDKNI